MKIKIYICSIYKKTITVATQVARRKIFYFPRSHFDFIAKNTQNIQTCHTVHINRSRTMANRSRTMTHHHITCSMCGEDGETFSKSSTPPTVCGNVCCNDMKQLLPDLKKQSFALRFVNRDQAQAMRDFPSPPLQLGAHGWCGCPDRDANAETEKALRTFILSLAYASSSDKK